MSGNISDSENELKIYRFKILMIGDQRVGKSAICQQLCNSTHVQTYKETYGCDFYLKVN